MHKKILLGLVLANSVSFAWPWSGCARFLQKNRNLPAPFVNDTPNGLTLAECEIVCQNVGKLNYGLAQTLRLTTPDKYAPKLVEHLKEISPLEPEKYLGINPSPGVQLIFLDLVEAFRRRNIRVVWGKAPPFFEGRSKVMGIDPVQLFNKDKPYVALLFHLTYGLAKCDSLGSDENSEGECRTFRNRTAYVNYRLNQRLEIELKAVNQEIELLLYLFEHGLPSPKNYVSALAQAVLNGEPGETKPKSPELKNLARGKILRAALDTDEISRPFGSFWDSIHLKNKLKGPL